MRQNYMLGRFDMKTWKLVAAALCASACVAQAGGIDTRAVVGGAPGGAPVRRSVRRWAAARAPSSGRASAGRRARRWRLALRRNPGRFEPRRR